jgi:phenylpropionate dioxygenase-like ring-hydroxylating dioxygenase large terminal subunit
VRTKTRADVLGRLWEVARADAPRVTPSSTSLSVDRYLDGAQLDAERSALFRRRPVIVAHGSEIAEPGAFACGEVAGMPVLVVRGADDRVRLFVNVCRHRGARLVTVSDGTRKAFTCPYHAWTYRLDGALEHVPHEDVFGPDFDRSTRGLRELPSEERHGFVWARLDGAAPPAVAAFLGEALDDDFDAFGLTGYRAVRRRVQHRVANWKLVMDAFAEGYHVKSLHRTTLARFFLDAAIVDDLTPHVRQVGARKRLRDVGADVRPDQLFEVATVFYNVFPNAIFVFHPDWISQITLLPEAPDRVAVDHRMLVRGDPDGEAMARLDKSWAHIDGAVFEHEDLAIAESIQAGLSAGTETHVLMGGMETGMRLFHAARDRALDEG